MLATMLIIMTVLLAIIVIYDVDYVGVDGNDDDGDNIDAGPNDAHCDAR